MQVTMCDKCQAKRAEFMVKKANPQPEDGIAMAYLGRDWCDYCRECLVAVLTAPVLKG